MSYRSLGSDEVTLRNYRPVGRRKGNMSLIDPLAAGVINPASSVVFGYDLDLGSSAVPGVGTIVALTYAAAIDDPARFTSSKTVGAHFGLTPTRYQSGETDRSGRISKIGDASVRATLYESANIIITRPVKGCTALKSWAMRIAKRAGMKKAKVALARKLAVIMHRMLVDGTTFTTQPA